MPFSSNVTRMISLSVVWGTLLATHLRRRRNEADNQSSTLALEDRCSPDQRALLHVNNDMVTNTESSPEIWGGHETTSELAQTDPALLLLSDSTSLLRRVLSAIGSFVSPTPAEEQAVIALVDRLFAESMNVIKGIALSLDLPTHMPESFYAKLPFRRSNSTINSNLKSLMEDFELLTFYCKSNEFLKAVAPANISLELVQHAMDKLENVAICLLATYFPVDVLEEASALCNSSSDRLNLLLCLDVPAVRDITPFPAFRPKKDHLIRFGYCQYQFASFLAYLSIMPGSLETLSLPSLEGWLNLWTASQDIRLQLLSVKIAHNIQAHKQLSSAGQESNEDEVEVSSDIKRPIFYLPNGPSPVLRSSQTPSKTNKILNPPVIYGPDLYKLDKRNDRPDSPPPEIDVIFLNGMLGSVFHTWRQSDLGFANGENGVQENIEDPSTVNLRLPAAFPGQVSCWPQTWLSEEFPNARIIGINVNLKPFIWNPICPGEKTKRRIDQRARDILQQLLMAGVGRRPIIWIAHSAGGILTKELIKLSATWFSESPSNNITNSSPTLSGATRSAVPFVTSLLRSNTDYTNIGVDGDGVAFEYQRMDMAALLADCGVDMELPGSIAEQTKGIIFLSVPHRGNQSMMFLYHFPMVFTLTPEAKQLQQNSASIVGLHNWFLGWASRHPLQVLNMVEERVTVVNRWYSVHLVLPEPQDTEFSEVVLVDTDHAGICKPKSPEDDVYRRITGFIHRILEDIPTS